MAGIVSELTLRDKFTSVIDRFIGKLEKSNRAVERQQAEIDALERAAQVKTQAMVDAAAKQAEADAQAAGAIYKMTDAYYKAEKFWKSMGYSQDELIQKGLMVRDAQAEAARAAEMKAAAVAQAEADSAAAVAQARAQIEADYARYGEDVRAIQDEWERVSTAGLDGTEDLIAHFENLQASVKTIADYYGYASNEARYAFSQMDEAMALMGVSWTDIAGEVGEKTDLLTTSFERLRELGVVSISGPMEEAVGKADRLKRAMKMLGEETAETGKKAKKAGEDAEKASRVAERGTGRLERTVKSLITRFFGVYAIIRMVKNTLGRMPDDSIRPFNKLKSTISDTFGRGTARMLGQMQKAMERLNRAIESPKGQRVLKVVERLLEGVGSVLAFVIDKVALLVEWVGDHLQPVLAALSVVLSAMLVLWLAQHAAMLPVIATIGLLIAAVAVLANAFEKFGVTTSDVIGFVAGLLGFLYATAYNVFADIYNVIATFAEFFANVFNNPVAAIVRLFVNLFDTILGIVERVAGLIDKIVGTNWSGAVAEFRGKVNSWAEEKYGDDYIKLERMEHLDYSGTIDKWVGGGKQFGESLSNMSLDNMTYQAIKSVAGSSASTAANTKEMADSLADEDLKMLIDVATQKFVSKVNLLAQTPVINISGQNTGDSDADRKALARTIRDILIDQMASGSTTGYYAMET